MRIGMGVAYGPGQDFHQAVDALADYEKAGLDLVVVPELYGFDGVSRLGYIAARLERVQLASGILQTYPRTPTLMAMTAAGLDSVSRGRFNLGIGASGPQVIEGFHGIPYDAPIGRTRELIEICRIVWRREKLVYDGKYYKLPVPEGQGTGLGKPLKMIDHPVRPRVPITLAAIGPKNVALAAELAEGWQPPFFVPEKAADVWSEPLAAGSAKRDPSLGTLDLQVGVSLAIGDDVDHLHDLGRPQRALYIGGMGARGRNFYNNLATWFGYEAEAKRIQDLYLDGKKKEAEAAVPRDLLVKTSLIGPEGHVRERLAALREAGVKTITVRPIHGETHADKVKQIERFRELCDAT